MRWMFLLLACPCSFAAAQSSSLSVIEREKVLDGYGLGWGAKFGRDVLLDGTSAVVMHASSIPPMSATEYRLVQGSWTFQAYTPGASWSEDFRSGLLLKGNPHFLQGPGRVAVERKDITGWTSTWLLNPDITTGDEDFGFAVAVDGTTVVVGNPHRTQSFFHEGSIHVYEDTGSDLVLRQSFYGGAVNRRLGWNLALDGDDLLVTYAAGSFADIEAYERDGGTWSRTQTSLGILDLQYGHAEIDDGVALVAENNRAHVFVHSGGLWVLDQTLPPLPAGAFIREFAVADGVLAIGNAESDLAGTDAGAVYLYARNDGWKLQSIVTASDAEATDRFGSGLDLDRTRLMVGAPWDDDGAPDQGAVYDFTLVHDPARVYCVPEVASLGCIAHVGFSGTPSVSSSAPFLVTASNVLSHRTGALVYGTSGPAYLPYPGGIRCVAPPRRTTARQSSGGTPNVHDCSGALSLDFNALIASGVDPLLLAGQVVDGQWFFRDPNGPSALASSDAIEFTIEP